MEKQQQIWQIGSGSSLRSYADVFLKHGVALIGPGDPGRWSPERSDEEFYGGHVRSLASMVCEGDIFLLRKGRSRIRAIGLVAGEYEYLEQFDDVYGWDLQHARRVRWCKLPQDHDFGRPLFGANPSRFSRTSQKEVTQYVRKFLNSPPTHWQTAALPLLPAEESPLEVIPNHLQERLAEIRDLVPLFGDRDLFGENPTEDELVGHFVIPFFRSMGWPPERIAVKWRYIDVAIFEALPRTPKNCKFVVEVKRFGAGVEGALKQAKRYVRALGVSCDIVVTDGIRYRMYSGKNNFDPLAYAHLLRLKSSAMDLFERLKRQ